MLPVSTYFKHNLLVSIPNGANYILVIFDIIIVCKLPNNKFIFYNNTIADPMHIDARKKFQLLYDLDFF